MTDDAYLMADWTTRCKDKIRTPANAVAGIRRGDKVFVGSGAAEPQQLVQALIKSAGRLADTRIMHIMTLGVAPYTEEKFTDQFRHNAFFIGANTRQAVNEGRAEIAFLVADDWQGKGIGTFLMRYLVKIAKSKKIKGFTAEVMRDNAPMIALMHKAGVEPVSKVVDGSYLFTMDF